MTHTKARVMEEAQDIPRWLQVMRAITGLTEAPGADDNDKILAMAQFIAHRFPEMQEYCDQYRHDDIAWCGLTVAFCMAVCKIRPPFGPTDTDRFLWAQSFKPWMYGGAKIIGTPVPGCIVVMTRSGGGHVTMFEEIDDDGNYRCRGGNQSDCVCVSSYDPDTVIALVWPTKGGDVPEIPVEDRPMLERGDEGPHVVDLQSMIPRFTGEIDGDFGPETEENVIRYQQSRGLEVDGIVGEETWGALYENRPPLPPPEPPPGALTAKQCADIVAIAQASDISDYVWDERGVAPVGYINGMAVAFAQTYLKLKKGHAAAVEMAKARTDSDKDALNVYIKQFQKYHMSNERDGIDTLRHLYALMIGSGMRESSGRHCEGRDLSAENTSSDTAEAGLFQTSYNAHGASDPEFDQLMDEYSRSANEPTCYLGVFAVGVTCSSSEWDSYGSGKGLEFQDLCKSCPAFAVETHGLTLRNLCNHYGPIIRLEVELRPEANDMLTEVQAYMDNGGVA
jgi:uncharacterized protein (TIGR02594 family)